MVVNHIFHLILLYNIIGFFLYKNHTILSECNFTHYGADCSQSCSVNCVQSACTNETGVCTYGCKTGFYGDMCNSECRRCPQGCDREMGNCSEHCTVGRFGELCERTCNKGCVNGCAKSSGTCNSCVVGRCGDFCNESCYIFDKCQYNSSKCTYFEYCFLRKSVAILYI